MKDFEPYRILWSTASDWLRSYDSWMNDPIISVNAEDIEKNVTEMYGLSSLFFLLIFSFSQVQKYAQIDQNIRRK